MSIQTQTAGYKMPSGSLNHEAARSLVQRALQAETQGEAELLLGAAYRLDKTINADAIANIWQEQWLEANKNRKGTLTNE